MEISKNNLIAGIATAPGYQTLRELIDKHIEAIIKDLVDNPQTDLAQVNHELGELKGMRFILDCVNSAVKAVTREEKK